MKDRELRLEAWYPDQPSESAPNGVYQKVTRSHQPFELQGESYRDATPLEGKEKYPLVVLSHGYTGYRTFMFYLGEHLASHGDIVTAIDHTGSANAEVDFTRVHSSVFLDTLFHRYPDQQFVLNYLSQVDHPKLPMMDAQTVALIGYSMGDTVRLTPLERASIFQLQSRRPWA